MPAPCSDTNAVEGMLVLYCVLEDVEIVLASVTHVDNPTRVDLAWGPGGMYTANNVNWSEFPATDRWHCPGTEENPAPEGWRTLSDARSKEPV